MLVKAVGLWYCASYLPESLAVAAGPGLSEWTQVSVSMRLFALVDLTPLRVKKPVGAGTQ